jgi:uncharacterized protein
MAESLEIDSLEFARRANLLEGSFELARMRRLTDLLALPDGRVDWRVEGRRVSRTGGSPDSLLRLRLSAQLQLPCGRCLGAVPVAVSAERDYLLASSEEEAARRDDPESDFDILVGSRRFDLSEWIEDELMLELPPVSFHQGCAPLSIELTPAASAEDEAREDRRKPFAALSRLKTPRSG